MPTPWSEGESGCPLGQIITANDLLQVADSHKTVDRVWVTGPPGALEVLGPGWAHAIALAFADAWSGAGHDRPPPPIRLTVDGGTAVGQGLALLSNGAMPPGWSLDLVLDATVPAPAVAALCARAMALHGDRVTIRTRRDAGSPVPGSL